MRRTDRSVSDSPGIGRTTPRPLYVPLAVQLLQIPPDRRFAGADRRCKLLEWGEPIPLNNLQNFSASLFRKHR